MEDTIIIVHDINELDRETRKAIWNSFNYIEKKIVRLNIHPQLKLKRDYNIEIINGRYIIKVLNKSKRYKDYMDLLRDIEDRIPFIKIYDIIGWEVA